MSMLPRGAAEKREVCYELAKHLKRNQSCWLCGGQAQESAFFNMQIKSHCLSHGPGMFRTFDLGVRIHHKREEDRIRKEMKSSSPSALGVTDTIESIPKSNEGIEPCQPQQKLQESHLDCPTE